MIERERRKDLEDDANDNTLRELRSCGEVYCTNCFKMLELDARRGMYHKRHHEVVEVVEIVACRQSPMQAVPPTCPRVEQRMPRRPVNGFVSWSEDFDCQSHPPKAFAKNIVA